MTGRAAINRSEALFLNEDGEVMPITDWYDIDADPCDEPDALAAVAGPDSKGRWYTLALSEFEGGGFLAVN